MPQGHWWFLRGPATFRSSMALTSQRSPKLVVSGGAKPQQPVLVSNNQPTNAVGWDVVKQACEALLVVVRS